MHAWNKSGDSVEHPDPWGKFGVFTTLRILPGPKTLFKRDHFNRMAYGAKSLKMSWIPDFTELSGKFEEYLKGLSNQKNQLIRICLFENCLGISSRKSISDGNPVLGLMLHHRRLRPDIKSTADKELYGRLLHLDLAREDLIIHDPEDDQILESATANLIFVRGDELVVPEKKVLPGITLQKLLPDLEKNHAITRENPTVQDVSKFDEILLCGTGRGVAPLMELKELGWSRRSNHAFQKIRSIYENLIKVENAPI